MLHMSTLWFYLPPQSSTAKCVRWSTQIDATPAYVDVLSIATGH